MKVMLKEMREKRGMTQTKLAEISGVSRAIINGLESGRTTDTKTSTISKLCTALSCTIDEIFFCE